MLDDYDRDWMIITNDYTDSDGKLRDQGTFTYYVITFPQIFEPPSPLCNQASSLDRFPIYGSRVQNHFMATFILPRSIK